MKPASVAVLPYPLTAGTLFGYGILRFLGHINEGTHTRFTRVSAPRANLLGCGERIVNLHCGELYPKVLGLIREDTHLQRILNFSCYGDHPANKTKTMYVRMVSALQKLNTDTGRQALGEVFALIVKLREERGDIWKAAEALDAFVAMLESFIIQHRIKTYPVDRVTKTIPVFKKTEQNLPEGVTISDDVSAMATGYRSKTEDDIDVTKSFKVRLEEGRICELQGKNITVVIGGPPQSGKSSLAVSVAGAMGDYIESLKSRATFAGFDLSVAAVDIDFGTPTTRAIMENWGRDREKIVCLKKPWTIDLAEKAQEELLRARQRYNIVIADLPGRITDVTELLASTADAGIIISNDWSVLKKEWGPFMANAGLPVLSRIKSRKADEGLSSLITVWRPGEQLNGRIVGLNRTQKSFDLFIEWLVPFLLFDILPTQFEVGT